MEYSILIVDDQAENIKAVSTLLREMKLGKKIYSAPNGEIALQLIKKYSLDLIITDWDMPVMNGIELVKYLKHSNKYSDIPVIMVTAVKTDDSFLKESFDVGVHDYIKKPYNRIEFFARIKATLKFQSELIKNKKRKQEIAKQSKLLLKQNSKLEQLNELKSRFLSIVSHDSKAPLIDLDGILSILSQDENAFDKNQIRYYFTQTHLKIKNVISFLNNLLFWSKTQIENETSYLRDINLKLLTEEILNLYHLRISNKNIKILNSVVKNSSFYLDKELVAFILRNLIDNAIKFTPPKGQVEIFTETNHNSILISVKDNGVGISSDNITNIFADGINKSTIGTRGEKGTGLGLSLCKELADRNKWDLTVESVVSIGTKFSLVIPLNNSSK